MTNSTLPAAITDLYARAWARPEFRMQSSIELHSALYHWIAANWAHGAGIIELGVYRGAASITLAYAARQFNMPYVAIDTNRDDLHNTCKMLVELGIIDHPCSWDGTLAQFVDKGPKLFAQPLLVFIDGCHDQSAVREDIQAVYRMNKLPIGLAVHDFSLRSHRMKETGVDRAVFEAFGPDVEYQRIGEQFGPEPIPGKDCPTESGCWWLENGTEGILLELANYPELKI